MTGSQKRFFMGNFIIQEQRGCHCPEGHITDPRNMGTEETSRRERGMETSSEGRTGPRRGCSIIDGMEMKVE